MQNFILPKSLGHLLNTHLILNVCDHGKKCFHMLQMWKIFANILKIFE